MGTTEAAVTLLRDTSCRTDNPLAEDYGAMMKSAIAYLKRLFDPQPPTPEPCGAGHPGGYKCFLDTGHTGPHSQVINLPNGRKKFVEWGPTGYELYTS